MTVKNTEKKSSKLTTKGNNPIEESKVEIRPNIAKNTLHGY